MENPINRATEIALDQLPPFLKPAAGPPPEVSHIAGCLCQVLDGHGDEGAVVLPSLAQLKEHFHCSHLDIYDVLRALRHRGFDYSFGGLDAPLRLWRVMPPD